MHPVDNNAAPTPSVDALQARIAALESALADGQKALEAERALVEKLTAERDRLRASHERLRLDLELLKNQIFVAKAERVDTQQLELEFAEKLAELTRLDQQLAAQLATEDAARDEATGPRGKGKSSPKGRRDLRLLNLPEERIELADPVLEDMVARGAAERIGFEESCKLGRKRGGLFRVVVARAKYRVPGKTPETTEIATAPMPPESFRRSMAAPSLLAQIIVDKFADGLPLNRIENRFAREGVSLDRGTMARWLEDAGPLLVPRSSPRRARRRWSRPSASYGCLRAARPAWGSNTPSMQACELLRAAGGLGSRLLRIHTEGDKSVRRLDALWL